MLERVTSNPEDRVAAIVAEVLAKRGVSGSISPDADLGRLGMTSVDMVELMLGVEAEFDLTIPAEEITIASFGSAGGIADLVRRLSATH